MSAKPAGLAGAAIAALVLVSTSPDDGWAHAFPYADRVPADAAVYVAVPDLPDLMDRLEAHPEWVRVLGLEGHLARLDPARPWLAGPAAFYAVVRDGRLRWTALVRLRNGVTHVDGTDYVGPDSMARVLADCCNDPPRTRVVLNFDALPGPTREVWGDFSRAVLDLDLGRALTIRGVLTYRPGTTGEVLDRRVHVAPTPVPGDAVLAHSGLTDVPELVRALGLNPPIPERILRSMGPAWGVEVRSAGDVALWFEARGAALRLPPGEWNGFHVEVREGRVMLWTRTPSAPGAPGTHAQTGADSAAAAAALRALLGPRAEFFARILDRTGRIESRVRYRGKGAEVEMRVRPPAGQDSTSRIAP